VARVVAGRDQILRRARGYTPLPVALRVVCPVPLLACGGDHRAAFCLVKGDQAFMSHSIGELRHPAAREAYREGIAHFERLFGVRTAALAHDLDPGSQAIQQAARQASAQAAREAAQDAGAVRTIAVQHHHAHIASVVAEHGVSERVIGITADSGAYGADGALWGGEVLIADLTGFERAAHLAYVSLPDDVSLPRGEDAAAEPWRTAVAYLAHAFGADVLTLDLPTWRGTDPARWREAARALLGAPVGGGALQTSSLGRLFAAVAVLLGLGGEDYGEERLITELEMVAEPGGNPYPFAMSGETSGEAPAVLEVSPLIRGVVGDVRDRVSIARIAGRFHRTIVELLAAACVRIRAVSGLGRVALGGDLFRNRLLLVGLIQRLEEHGFAVDINQQVPGDDGGLSLGHAAVAAALLHTETPSS
jgi:hydrogenase maturation protein HypF